MSPATTPEPKTWNRARITPTDLNREVRDQLRDLQTRVNSLTGGGGGSLFPTAAVVCIGNASVPSGWLLCDGRTVLIDDYTALHAQIGTAYNTGGENVAIEFRLPKLNEAMPRMGLTTASDGLLNTRGVGAGANSSAPTHPATVGSTTPGTYTSGNNSHNHVHDSFAIHAGSGHSFAHNHTVNQNTGGHNHNVGHNHNLSVQGVTINRNTGTKITAVGHNHSVIATNIDSSGDGAHNHPTNSNSSTSTVNATSTDTGNFSAQIINQTNVNSAHSHDHSHEHTWGTTHTFPQVPASLSVNWIIKA